MTSLALINRSTGQLVEAVDATRLLAAAGITDPRGAETRDLAAFSDDAAVLKRIAAEAQAVAGEEMIRRMDQRASWTLHEEGYTIKAPSPEAGTTAYDVDMLHDALMELQRDGVIDAEGAAGALEESMTTAPVPYDLLRDTLEVLDGDVNPPVVERVAAALIDLLDAEPEPTYRPRLSGIKALMKVPAARERIEACIVKTDPPRRVARVKRDT